MHSVNHLQYYLKNGHNSDSYPAPHSNDISYVHDNQIVRAVRNYISRIAVVNALQRRDFEISSSIGV